MLERIIQEIKEKLDIVEFIGNYVELKKVGSYYRGLCPFHQEKNPSFFVSPSRQMFKCFGCGAAGDVVTFYMRIEGLEFKEAINRLAEKLGIDIKSSSEETVDLSEIKKILEINKIAMNYYKRNLRQKEEVIKYLKNRGLKENTIEFFDIGYAEEGSHLRDYLFNLGYSLNEIMESGLLNERKEDKFQSRIIFPLIDHKKRIVGFTGRLFVEKENAPKYLNSPETKIFKKNNFIYGLVYSLENIEAKNEAIITEGQFDLILAYQEGLKNIVAVSGSSLTENQLKILKRYCKKIIFAFDNDLAGFKASVRAGLMALKEGFEIYKLKFGPYKDLAEFFENNEKVDDLQKIDFIEYLLEIIQNDYDLDILDKKREAILLVLPFIKFLDNIKRAYYISKLSEIVKIRESFLIEELDKIDSPYLLAPYEERVEINFDRLSNLIERFASISIVLNKKEFIEDLKNQLDFEFRDMIDEILNNEENLEILKARGDYENLLHEDLFKELEFIKKEIMKEYYKRKIKFYQQLLNSKGFDNLEDILKSVKFYTERLKELEKNA